MGKELSELRPSPTVLGFFKRIEKQFMNQTGQEIAATVGVHIRMQSNLEADVPGIYSLGQTDARGASSRMIAVAKQRQLCHFKHFLDIIRIRQLMNPFENTYIISSDCKEARDGVIQELGSNAFVPHLTEYRECSRSTRDAVCVQLAFAVPHSLQCAGCGCRTHAGSRQPCPLPRAPIFMPSRTNHNRLSDRHQLVARLSTLRF